MDILKNHGYFDAKQKYKNAANNIITFNFKSEDASLFSGTSIRCVHDKIKHQGSIKTYENVMSKIDEIFDIDIDDILKVNRRDLLRVIKIIIISKSHQSNYSLLFS